MFHLLSAPRRIGLVFALFAAVQLVRMSIRADDQPIFHFHSPLSHDRHGAAADPGSRGPSPDRPLSSPCDDFVNFVDPETDALKRSRFGLTSQITLHRRCVRAVSGSAAQGQPVPTVLEPLLAPVNGSVFALDSQTSHIWGSVPLYPPLSLPVASPFPQERYPQIMFGVATTLARIEDSLDSLSHWLAGTGSRLVVIVVDADRYGADDLDKVTTEYRNREVEVVLAKPSNPSVGANEQHFAMLRDLMRFASPRVEWISVMDDDTFFPSLYPLAKLLETYDASGLTYLGALSESAEAIKRWGHMAYGGAGAFLSIALARQLEPFVEVCLSEHDVPQGDWLLSECIRNKTGTPLTPVPGLHQLDMMGGIDGFYESGRFPISIHHWKSWHHVPVIKMAKITEFCGFCFLQRWQFGSDTVLNNGYSISVYPGGAANIDLGATEATFDNPSDFESSLGPLRDPSTDKREFYLVDADWVGNGVRQTYVRRASQREPVSPDDNTGAAEVNRDEVVELWWDRV